MHEIIHMENVSFSYGRQKALDQISLRIESGVYGLLGPNGAGKTTLMKVLLGFLAPQSGTGKLMGYDIRDKRKEVRKNIGYMPESECLLPSMDAVTLTAYLGALSGMPRQESIKRAHDVLYYVGLEEARYRRVETYSTGMKQRLKLAQALVHDPKLLLLDEPTSGMDPAGRKEMLELLRDIARKQSMNVIVSSHLLPDIELTCQYVLILNKGKIVAQQSIDASEQEKVNPFEVHITGNKEQFCARLLANDCKLEEGEKGNLKILFPAGQASNAIFKIAVETGVQVRYFKKMHSTLEDVFMKAIGANGGY